MGWIALLLISLAISMDGFGVGLSYGMRKMKLPFLSLCMVGLCTFTTVYASVSFGYWLEALVTPATSYRIGAAVLIVMGLFTLWRMITQPINLDVEEALAPQQEKRQFEWTIHMFGLMIHVLRDPQSADADRSGHIGGWEAVLLGFALSLDAFGAGISLTMLGFHPLLTAVCVALVALSMLTLGILMGRRFAEVAWFRKVSYLPPLLLITIGFLKMGK